MTRHEFVIRGCMLLMAAFCLAAILSLVGCAAPAPAVKERYLTEAQDAEMKEKCVAGCVVLPVPLWKQIVDRLSGTAI